jgi:NAD+ synthase
MDTRELAREISLWIKRRVEEAGRKGVVVGISGGVDSAVAAGLAQKELGAGVLGLILPCHSQADHIERAETVAESLNLEARAIDLGPVFDLLKETLPESTELAWANIKPRLRMITLYHVAAQRDYLVLGTGNRSEIEAGYFTKYGDGGVDLLPLGALFKSQVRELAGELSIPGEIIEAPPSAGLWHGQTDEEELGVTYLEIEDFFLKGEGAVSKEAAAAIARLCRTGRHKAEPVPVFEPKNQG